MTYQLPKLPYAYDALVPTIDEETMHLHHEKHHNTYVTNLNAALKNIQSYQKNLLKPYWRKSMKYLLIFAKLLLIMVVDTQTIHSSGKL